MSYYPYVWPHPPLVLYPPYVDPYYQSSPLSAEPPSSPFTPRTRRVHFEDEYWPFTPRRRPSYWPPQTPGAGPWSLPLSTVPLPPEPAINPTYWQPPPPHYIPPQASCYYSPWNTNAYVSPNAGLLFAPLRPQIHPLLNGESLRLDIAFDLSSSSFNPLRPTGFGTLVPIGQLELDQVATQPPVTQMQITCTDIPNWPIAVNPGRYISLGDVLRAVHECVQTQITHLDWAGSTPSERIEISRAYTRRCTMFPTVAEHEREASQGVRRVDYLRERYMFGGLVRTSGNGFETMKLVVTASQPAPS